MISNAELVAKYHVRDGERIIRATVELVGLTPGEFDAVVAFLAPFGERHAIQSCVLTAKTGITLERD